MLALHILPKDMTCSASLSRDSGNSPIPSLGGDKRQCERPSAPRQAKGGNMAIFSIYCCHPKSGPISLVPHVMQVTATYGPVTQPNALVCTRPLPPLSIFIKIRLAHLPPAIFLVAFVRNGRLSGLVLLDIVDPGYIALLIITLLSSSCHASVVKAAPCLVIGDANMPSAVHGYSLSSNCDL